ncbi:MAG: hypothetical protein IJW17_10605 [Lentisphaeria bacterium]|nr:hypothetical protein [Lentisphaeria bacterium]
MNIVKQTFVLLVLVCAGMNLYALGDIRKPETWVKHFSSNGKMEFNWDEENNAMNIQISYADTVKDRWAYPGLILSAEDKKADFLEFEIKVETNPENRGFRNCLILFQAPNWKNIGQLWYAAPGKEFKKVRFDLRKQKFDLTKVRVVRIGLNVKDAAEASIWLRNIKFVKAAE